LILPASRLINKQTSEIQMNAYNPCLVGEDESDTRGIKGGWYAVASNGTLVSGAFPSRQDCAQEIRHPTRVPIVPSSGKVPQSPIRVPGSWHAQRRYVAPVAMLTRAGPFWVIE
jgi:hypothetical protein